jgi:hypothetical protein
VIANAYMTKSAGTLKERSRRFQYDDTRASVHPALHEPGVPLSLIHQRLEDRTMRSSLKDAY